MASERLAAFRTRSPLTNEPSVLRLSTILLSLPADEICLLLQHDEEGIRAGIIEAAVEQETRFELTFLDLNGRQVTRKLDEEFILATDDWKRWLEEKRLASRSQVMTATKTLSTTEGRLTNTLDDLKHLARLRRDLLETNANARAKATTQATRPAGKKPTSKVSVKEKASPKHPAVIENPADVSV